MEQLKDLQKLIKIRAHRRDKRELELQKARKKVKQIISEINECKETQASLRQMLYDPYSYAISELGRPLEAKDLDEIQMKIDFIKYEIARLEDEIEKLRIKKKQAEKELDIARKEYYKALRLHDRLESLHDIMDEDFRIEADINEELMQDDFIKSNRFGGDG